MKKTTLISVAALAVLSSCSGLFGSNEKWVKSEDTQSLEYWTDDTVFFANPRLVRLMDTLYRYTRAETFPASNINRDIRWMNNYRQSLDRYYADTRNHCIVSPFVMADSVLAEARTLWEMTEDGSTMGMIISNSVENSRLTFEHFNEYSKLLNSCSTEEQRQLLNTEFDAWMSFQQLFNQLYDDCVEIFYWGGSICGPLRTAGALEIMDSHIDMYRRELPNGPGSLQGEYTGSSSTKVAYTTLLETCRASIPEFEITEAENDEYVDGYYQTILEAEELITQLPEVIDTWLEAREHWEKEMTPEHKENKYPRNTAQVLTNLSNALTSLTEE